MSQNSKRNIKLSYDPKYDVLYLRFSNVNNSYGDWSSYGVIIHRDMNTEKITGYTFTHFFSMYWNNELPDLSDQFNMTYEEIIIRLFEERMTSNREKDNNH